MGNIMKREEKIPTTLKLEAQKITGFQGSQDEFPMWKSRTQCAFEGVGYERILNDRTYAIQNPKMNKIVYSQLTVATVDGSAYHLILQHDAGKDGNAAWNSLIDWFQGDIISSETADGYRTKLTNLKLAAPTTAAEYINKFVQYTHNLEQIPGEGYSKSAQLQLFIRNIVDEDYIQTATWLRTASTLTLQEAINALRKTERDVRDKKSRNRRPIILNPRRLETDEDPPDFQGTIQTTAKGFLQLPPQDFRRLSTTDKEFIVAFNGKVKHGEDTATLPVPHGLTIAKPRRTRRIIPGITEASGKTKRSQREEDDTVLSPRTKKIHFGLEHSEADEDA
jgi:hypothetical protein